MGAWRIPGRYWLWVPLVLLVVSGLGVAGPTLRPVAAARQLPPTAAIPGTPSAIRDPYGRVAPDVSQQFGSNEIATYIVVLATQADTHNTVTDWAAQGQLVYDRLVATATSSQHDLRTYLAGQHQAGHVLDYQPLWIINAIVVTSDVSVLNDLAGRPEVSVIWANGTLHALGHPAQGAAVPAADPLTEPNITLVGAPQVWALGDRGAGVVVATLDTGVVGSHLALARKYRGWSSGGLVHDYNWWDAVNGQQANGPYDDADHGTHTLGIVLGSEADGSNQIGVAPDARWIAVKMLDANGEGTDAEALAAMQWVLAPTRTDGTAPRPDLRPQVVSNAWGAVCADTVTRGAVTAWRDAGIFATFAGGDVDGVTAPAAFPEAFAVGAINAETGLVAEFSGRGPSCYDGSVRPQIMAPGVEIRSSVSAGYSRNGWSGTSMAEAHVAGVAALIRAARPDLSVAAVMNILTSTASFPANAGQRPNNAYGWGVVDALAAYQAVQPPAPSPTTTPSRTPSPTPTAPPTNTPTPVFTPGPVAGCTLQFDDLTPDYWAYGYIRWFYCNRYVSGYANHQFGPDLNTTRAQFTKLIVLGQGWTPLSPATPSFRDVPRTYWAYPYIEAARAHGVISGYDDDTFQPTTPITRAQLAKILVQSRNWAVITPTRPTFDDVGPDHWAYGWIETVVQHGVAQGYHDRTFRPLSVATRAQLSKMLYAALTQP